MTEHGQDQEEGLELLADVAAEGLLNEGPGADVPVEAGQVGDAAGDGVAEVHGGGGSRNAHPQVVDAQVVDDLRRQIQEMSAALASMGQQLQQPTATPAGPLASSPVIHVTVPSTIRLKTFTGLTPKTKEEVSFPEWEAQCVQYLRDKSITGLHPKIMSSLRGIAHDQAKSCETAESILETLRSIYGSSGTAEDLYLEFSALTPTAKEVPSAFLCRLWGEMNTLNRDCRFFTSQDAGKKVYHIFCKGVSPLLALELRGKWGHPGEASPDLTELLKHVKRLEGSATHSKSNKVQMQAHVATEETPWSDKQLDALAERVASKLKVKGPPFRSSSSSGRPRGHCFRCGLVGDHYAKDCTAEPNPTRVREEEDKRRQRIQNQRALNQGGSVGRGGH